eukprot:evm.model.NODE_49416_length_6225_cov_23.907631.2
MVTSQVLHKYIFIVILKIAPDLFLFIQSDPIKYGRRMGRKGWGWGNGGAGAGGGGGGGGGGGAGTWCVNDKGTKRSGVTGVSGLSAHDAGRRCGSEAAGPNSGRPRH